MTVRSKFVLAATPLLLMAAPVLAQSSSGPVDPNEVDMPDVSGRQATVGQTGYADVAQISQTAANAYARVRQDGERNEAMVDQRGSGSAYADVAQTGDRNLAGIAQDGPGENVLYLTQAGNDNRAAASQNASGALHNGAVMTQLGYNNEMALAQDGSDNRAVLTQEGNDNEMAASQVGDGNRLEWTQQGVGLPSLGIAQSGGQAVQIVQTGGQ